MIVLINTHHHDWDCETCGGSCSTTVSFENEELGFYIDGEPATCFTGRDGYLPNVLLELNSRLKTRGITIELMQEDSDLEQKFFEIMESIDWDFDKMTPEQEEVQALYDKGCDEYNSFYNEDALKRYYSNYGIELQFEESCDEIEYYDKD